MSVLDVADAATTMLGDDTPEPEVLLDLDTEDGRTLRLTDEGDQLCLAIEPSDGRLVQLAARLSIPDLARLSCAVELGAGRIIARGRGVRS